MYTDCTMHVQEQRVYNKQCMYVLKPQTYIVPIQQTRSELPGKRSKALFMKLKVDVQNLCLCIHINVEESKHNTTVMGLPKLNRGHLLYKTHIITELSVFSKMLRIHSLLWILIQSNHTLTLGRTMASRSSMQCSSAEELLARSPAYDHNNSEVVWEFGASLETEGSPGVPEDSFRSKLALIPWLSVFDSSRLKLDMGSISSLD